MEDIDRAPAGVVETGLIGEKADTEMASMTGGSFAEGGEAGGFKDVDASLDGRDGMRGCRGSGRGGSFRVELESTGDSGRNVTTQPRDGSAFVTGMDGICEKNDVGIRARIHPQRRAGVAGVSKAADGKYDAAGAGVDCLSGKVLGRPARRSSRAWA